MTAEELTATAPLDHPVGLHARPSVKLTRLAKRFACRIELRADGGADWVDAKSIVKVMGLKARQGVTLEFRVIGDDGPAALAALTGLVRNDFEDGSG